MVHSFLFSENVFVFFLQLKQNKINVNVTFEFYDFTVEKQKYFLGKKEEDEKLICMHHFNSY